MDLIGLLLILSLLFNAGLVLFVHSRSSRNTANLIFEAVIYILILWHMGMIFFRVVPLESSINLAKILYFAASFTAPSFLLFSLYFPQEKPSKYLVAVVALLTGIVAFLTLSPSVIIKDVLFVPGEERKIIFGPAYPLYIVHVAGLFTAFYGVLIYKLQKYQQKSALIKLQIQYLLLSTSLVSFLAMVTNLFLPTIGIFRFNWLGQVLTTFWVAGISYAIVRHRLMDIRLVVARTVAYTIIITLIGVFYVASAFIISSIFLGFDVAGNQLILYAFLTIIVALSFEKLKRQVEKFTDSIFFKGQYNPNAVLSKIGHVMSTTIDLPTVTTQILQTLVFEMRISKGAFILLEGGKIYDVISTGFTGRSVFDMQISNFLNLPDDLIVFDELEEGTLKEWMRTWGISVARVLKVNEEKVGLLILGDKASGETYSLEDLRLISILAPEVAVAIQNSKSYDKIKKFNVTLSQEVDKATADLIKTSRQLESANLKLMELDRLKDDFVSVASHELRTPMTAIRSYAWMALNRSDVPLSAKLKKYLNRTLISTERLINLVNDMLNISRIESGKVEVVPGPFSIQRLSGDVLNEVLEKAQEKNLHLHLLNSQVPAVFADEDKVHQILLNLIGNAIKFTPVGGEITVSFFCDGSTVETSIKDNGLGIVKDDMPKLFKKFNRLDNSFVGAATAAGGTGLGLYICKELVNLMSGQIWVKSEGLGKGSVFTFSLPVATKENLAHGGDFTRQVDGTPKMLEPVAV